MLELEKNICRFVHEFSLNNISNSLKNKSTFHLMDTLGCMLAATNHNTFHIVKKYCMYESASQVGAIGLNHLTTLMQACLINGTLARVLEFDDMHNPSIIHASGVILPSVLVAAEYKNLNGEDILSNYILGVELCLRFAMAAYDPSTKNSFFLQRGLDSTALCGALASALVIAKMFHFTEDKIQIALGIALSLASGSLEANRSGGSIKQLQSGLGAAAGMQAVLLTEAGITGPLEALEGSYGFYSCFTNKGWNKNVILKDIGEKWFFETLRYKPYPSNYFTHSSIDIALELKSKSITYEDIKQVNLFVALPMIRTAAEPYEVKWKPDNIYSAKFSIPYTFAIALQGGHCLGIGFEEFQKENISSQQVINFMKKISVFEDSECNDIFPHEAPAKAEIIYTSGEKENIKVLFNRGSQQNPLSKEDILTKFYYNTEFLDLHKKEVLKEMIFNISKKTSSELKDFFKILCFG